MDRYVVAVDGNKLTLTQIDVTDTDNVAVGANTAVFTPVTWALLHTLTKQTDETKMLAAIGGLLAPLGMTLEDGRDKTP